MEYIAIDYGEKKVGLAGSQSGVIVTPLEIIINNNSIQLIQKLFDRINFYQPQQIVIGLPVNKDGQAGSQAQKVKAFGKIIGNNFKDKKIYYTNEFLTSIQAQERSRKKGVASDDHAAAIILEQFLKTQK